MFYLSLWSGLVFVRYALSGLADRKRLYPLVLLGFVLLSAFRFDVGCDWNGYYRQYVVFANLPWEIVWTSQDPLWVALIVALNGMEIEYPWLNVISSGVFFWGMHALARRQPDPLSFIILLFPILIINMPMSGIRQGGAIGLMGFAFVAFLDKRPFRLAAITVAATLVHSSAMIFLLLLPFVFGRFSAQRVISAILVSLPALFAILQTDSASLAFERYVESGIDAAGAFFRLASLFLTGLFFFFVLSRSWRRRFPEDYGLVAVGALAMTAMIALLPISSVIGDRFGYYLIPFQAMIFARIPLLSISKSKSIWIALPYVALFALTAVWINLSWIFEICYIPYRSWIFGYPVPLEQSVL